MASITRYGDRWRAQVAIKGVRKSAVWGTKREAIAWANRIENEIEDGLKGGKTFLQAVDEYKLRVSVNKRNPIWEARRLAAFTEYFGPGRLLAKITSDDIGRWRDFRLKGGQLNGREHKPVVGATVQRESNLLSNLFTVARKEWKWIQTHPFEGVRMPEQADARHQVWRWQQMKRVLRSDRAGKTGEVVKAFHIALHTALRLSEIISGQYDPRLRVIVLNRSKGDGNKRVLVPVTRRAAKLFPVAFTVGANEASTLFSDLRQQLLIEDLTFHDTRATALTLLSRRMDVMTLARISRHKDLNILLNTYYRERPEDISARI